LLGSANFDTLSHYKASFHKFGKKDSAVAFNSVMCSNIIYKTQNEGHKIHSTDWESSFSPPAPYIYTHWQPGTSSPVPPDSMSIPL